MPPTGAGLYTYTADEAVAMLTRAGFHPLSVSEEPCAYLLPSPELGMTPVAVPFLMVDAQRIARS